ILTATALDAAITLIVSGTCYATYESLAAVDYSLAAAYELLAEDPPDSNFTVIATPAIPTLSTQPVSAAATGMSPQVASDLNALLSNQEQQLALLRVIPTTINRISGAVAARNAFWQTQQVHALQSYVSQLSGLAQS